MKRLLHKCWTPLRSRKAQGLVEYALILSLVAFVVVAALSKLSDPTGSPIVDMTTTLGEAG
jgi:Flp pilus assembly pilin Flp